MSDNQQQNLLKESEQTCQAAEPKKSGFKTLIAVDSNEQCRWAFERLMADSPQRLMCWKTHHIRCQSYMDVIHKDGHELILVHCPDTPTLPTFSFRAGSFPAAEIERKMVEHNEKESKVKGHYESLLQPKKINYQWRVFDSDHRSIGDEIIKMANAEKVDLIVMGSRALNPIKRTILHSVSDHVMHNTTIPVMICPHKHHKQPH